MNEDRRKCPKNAHKMMEAMIRGDLTKAETEALQDHILECDKCSEVWSDIWHKLHMPKTVWMTEKPKAAKKATAKRRDPGTSGPKGRNAQPRKGQRPHQRNRNARA